MADLDYSNVKLKHRNFVIVDGYFYTMDKDTDTLLVKTSDGSIAFSYPLDSTIGIEIVSLEHDGRNFWSIENYYRAASGDIPRCDYSLIKRWYIDNYVCKLRSTIDTLAWGESHQCLCEAFTIEHYHINFTSYEESNSNTLSISDGSKIESGITVALGPNVYGQVEEFTVSSYGSDYIAINGRTKYNYDVNDPISFYKNIYLFNNFNGNTQSNGALYKVNAYTGSFITKLPGGSFTDIKACTFYDVSNGVSEWGPSICYVKASNMIFLNIDDLTNSYGSMILDNIALDQTTIIPIYDLTIDNENIHRLQKDAVYKDKSYGWGTYNYQLSTLKPMVTSIALNADPAILPANGVNTSTITAVVRDQFNHPVTNKLVYFSDSDVDGYIFTDAQDEINDTVYANTNDDGVVVVGYKSGITAEEVIITATTLQG